MSDAPELSDVGAAVAAAQSAVEQVLAKAGIDAEASRQSARPKGLPRARNGKKDDLKRINGLGALDESTLNNLGVFHFDQIAGWSEAQVLWMENHVFARGRIGQESWQQQARDLAPPASS
jgi:NADH-quinone oxidoreductase subunit E